MIKHYALAIILSAAFILHIPGIFYGIPMKNNVGDEITIMGTIFKMFEDGTLRPAYASFYHLPMTLYFQLPFYALLVFFLLASGIFPDLETLRRFVLLDYGMLLPFARLLAGLFAVVSGYLIYRIVKKIGGNEKTALLATFLLSFNLMFFQVTHFARAWSLQVALILVALYAYLHWRESDDPKPRHYASATLATFLAYGVHIVSGMAWSVFGVFFLSKLKAFKSAGTLRRHLWYFALSNLGILLGVFVYFYLAPPGFLTYLNQPGMEKAQGIVEGFRPNMLYYLWIFFTYDGFLAALSLPAFIYFIKKKRTIGLGLLSYIVVFTSVIAYAIHTEPRFIVSTMPFFVIPVSFFISWLFDRVKEGYARKSLYALVVLIVMFLPMLWTKLIIAPNTLLLARDWVMAKVPADTPVVTNNFYIDIPENKKGAKHMTEVSRIGNTLERHSILSLPEEFLKKPRYFVRIDDTLLSLSDKSLGFKYAVISFWDRREMESLRSKLPPHSKLIRSFYPTAEVETSTITDIAGNMHNPFTTLLNVTMTGPYVEIYSL